MECQCTKVTPSSEFDGVSQGSVSMAYMLYLISDRLHVFRPHFLSRPHFICADIECRNLLLIANCSRTHNLIKSMTIGYGIWMRVIQLELCGSDYNRV